MKHPEYNTKYYYTVDRLRICKKIIPGWYYNLIPTYKVFSHSRWFFSVFPNYPTHGCCLGYAVELFYQKTKKHIASRDNICINKWIYIDIGKNADEYKYPLGLHFFEGKTSNMNRNVRKAIIFIIENFTEDNIISEKESDQLVKEKKIAKPFPKITNISVSKYCEVKERSEIAYRYFHAERAKEERKRQRKLQKRWEACQRKYERRRLRELEKQGG